MHLSRAALKAEKERLQKRLAAIEVLLEDEPNAVSHASHRTRRRPSRAKGKRTGLRPAIRSVLGEHPNGLKPSEVTAALRAQGFETRNGSSVALGTRVSNDLYRLAKAGQLHRTKGGKYKLEAGKEDGQD